MQLPPKVDKGTPLRAEDFNALLDYLGANEVKPGVGLEMRKTSTGNHLSVSRLAMAQITKKGEEEDCSGGTEIELGSSQGTQDSDTWDRDNDGEPVAVSVITDIQYDDTTLQLTYRTRQLHFDKCGKLQSVDAESDLVTITTAEACDE